MAAHAADSQFSLVLHKLEAIRDACGRSKEQAAVKDAATALLRESQSAIELS